MAVQIPVARPRPFAIFARTTTSRRALIAVLLSLGIHSDAAPALGAASLPPVTTVARLGGDPNGYHVQGALVLGTDQNYYGTTEAGGPPNCGTIFQLKPDGTLTTIYSFTGGNDGANPKAGLILGSGGVFYGTTSSGGSGGTGTVFSVTTAGGVTTLHGFSATVSTMNADGAFPSAALVKDANGDFFGTAYRGGAHGFGTIFKVTAGGVFTPLHSFDASAGEGVGSLAALVIGNDNNFYGTAETGGAHQLGTVFQVTPAGVVKTLYSFTGGTDDGANPRTGGLIKDGDGNFYGSTIYGTVYKIAPAGVFTPIHKFVSNTEGTAPSAPLILGSDGNLYGVTADRGPANSAGNGYGTIFQMTPAGLVTVLYTFHFTAGQGTLDGANPTAALVQDSHGDFYGSTGFGSHGNVTTPLLGPGTVFKLTGTGTLTTLHRFTAGGNDCVAALAEFPNHTLYGVTVRGGATNDGTIFGVRGDGKIETVHQFAAGTDGRGPATRLTPAGDGKFIGSCDQEGPNGGGTIFQAMLNPPAGGGSLVAASAPDEVPIGRLFLDALANLPSPATGLIEPSLTGEILARYYFYRPHGGTMGLGAISGSPSSGAQPKFAAAAVPSSLPSIYEFTNGDDGAVPLGGAAFGLGGDLFGTTSAGGKNRQGTVYRCTQDGHLTTLHAFAGTGDGAVPKGTLVRARDGNFYGTTTAASFKNSSPAGNGTVFKITSAGKLTTLHTFQDSDHDGIDPEAGLLEASDGTLYGTTASGGAAGAGTVFSITPAGKFTVIHSFAGRAGGARPVSALIEASDGFLYGVTSAGGTDDSGVVFRVELAPFVPSLSTLNGVYRGLGTTASAGAAPAGSLTLTLSGTGKLKGSFAVGTATLALSGTLAADASFSEMKRIAGHDVEVHLQADLTGGSDVITGTVAVDGVSYMVSLDRARFNAKTNAAPQAGRYTFALPPNADNSDANAPRPQGTGWATVSIKTSGSIKVVGKLADGTAFSAGGALSKAGGFSLFARLYGKLGLLAGPLSFATPPGDADPLVSDVTGMLTWTKPAQAKNLVFPKAFATTLAGTGSVYVAPAKNTRILPGTGAAGDATLAFTGGDLSATISKAVVISLKNAVAYPAPAGPTDKLKLVFVGSTGSFSGHFFDPQAAKSENFSGVVLTKQGEGTGFFVDPAGSGKLALKAAP